MAPIRVVNVVLAAGDGNRGVQTAAFNLPNDERVVREKGAKRVMLRNIQEAKFKLVLTPIAAKVLSPAQQKNVTFDAFFTHIVMHELMHGLGPHQIKVGGKDTTVRAQLKETYSAMEEAKADISGLFALQLLIDKGVLDKAMQESMYDTFLASAFRSIRFGVNEAHGRGIALQLNWLLDFGAFTVDKDGAFAVNPAKIRDGVDGPDRRDHDAAGGGRLREGEGHAGAPRGGPARGAEGAGPAARTCRWTSSRGSRRRRSCWPGSRKGSSSGLSRYGRARLQPCLV